MSSADPMTDHGTGTPGLSVVPADLAAVELLGRDEAADGCGGAVLRSLGIEPFERTDSRAADAALQSLLVRGLVALAEGRFQVDPRLSLLGHVLRSPDQVIALSVRNHAGVGRLFLLDRGSLRVALEPQSFPAFGMRVADSADPIGPVVLRLAESAGPADASITAVVVYRPDDGQAPAVRLAAHEGTYTLTDVRGRSTEPVGWRGSRPDAEALISAVLRVRESP